jgi:hypothetical protein
MKTFSEFGDGKLSMNEMSVKNQKDTTDFDLADKDKNHIFSKNE